MRTNPPCPACGADPIHVQPAGLLYRCVLCGLRWMRDRAKE